MRATFPNILNAEQRQEYLLNEVLENQALLQVLLSREAIRDAWERGNSVEHAVSSVLEEVEAVREIISQRFARPGQERPHSPEV